MPGWLLFGILLLGIGIGGLLALLLSRDPPVNGTAVNNSAKWLIHLIK